MKLQVSTGVQYLPQYSARVINNVVASKRIELGNC